MHVFFITIYTLFYKHHRDPSLVKIKQHLCITPPYYGIHMLFFIYHYWSFDILSKSKSVQFKILFYLVIISIILENRFGRGRQSYETRKQLAPFIQFTVCSKKHFNEDLGKWFKHHHAQLKFTGEYKNMRLGLGILKRLERPRTSSFPHVYQCPHTIVSRHPE